MTYHPIDFDTNMAMAMELTIKEMQMSEIQNIVVKLARFPLRSIVYVIIFILKLASYVYQRINYDLPGFFMK